MPYVDIVTALAILQYVLFGIKVGRARSRYGVAAPATSGDPIFERCFRVHQNTLEMLVLLVPGLYLFGHYFNPLWAAGLGVVYLVGREMYSASYLKNPAARGPGYGLSMLPSMILVIGGLTGAVLRLAGR